MGITYIRQDGNGTHGYQVRYGESISNNYKSEFISDRKHGGRKKAELKAKRRVKELGELYPELVNTGIRTKPAITNKYSDIAGVHKQKVHVRNSYLDARAASYKVRINGKIVQREKRFATYRRGEEEAKRLAIMFRRGWERAYFKGWKDVLKYLHAHNLHKAIKKP